MDGIITALSYLSLSLSQQPRVALLGWESELLTTHDRKKAPEGYGAELDVKTATAVTVCILVLVSVVSAQWTCLA